MTSFVRTSLVTLASAGLAAALSACTVHATAEPAAPPPPPPAEPVAAPAPPPPAPPAPAPAPPAPATHPAYLHALSDLRNARFNLWRRGGDARMRWDEHTAIEAIDRAIAEIKRAAIDDGKPLEDHPPVDAREPFAGRLHKALAALRAARADGDRVEDNAFASGLKARAVHHIDEAISLTERGIVAAERGE